MGEGLISSTAKRGRETTRGVAEGAAAATSWIAGGGAGPGTGQDYISRPPPPLPSAVPLSRCTGEDAQALLAGKPFGTAIHATAVTVGGSGLLILGPSRAGKSRLAAALIAASTWRRPIRLLGDDRVLLLRRGESLVARPHPRIAGFIERRGLGIVACPFVEHAVVRGMVDLGAQGSSQSDVLTFRSTTSAIGPEQNFPGLPLVTVDGTWPVDGQRDVVLSWCATLVQHLP